MSRIKLKYGAFENNKLLACYFHAVRINIVQNMSVLCTDMEGSFRQQTPEEDCLQVSTREDGM